MFPICDNIPSSRVPVVNYLMIGLCSIVFLFQLKDQNAGLEDVTLVEKYGMIPARITHPDEPVIFETEAIATDDRGRQKRVIVRREAESSGLPAVLTAFTCIFLHGGLMHFAGNMWFLYIFGDNVEDRLGHVGYLLFYLAAGVAASITHLLAGPSSTIPTIGASGAIAGVMGAYFIWYPKAEVDALVPFFGFLRIMRLPAVFFLGLWAVMQLLPGLQSLNGNQGGGGGVAWWAHIGGFAVGIIVAFVAPLLHLVPAAQTPLAVRRRVRSWGDDY
ncbi:MAG: rhomboid family intramembrane serine protease [Planctomycetaceae bacterium]